MQVPPEHQALLDHAIAQGAMYGHEWPSMCELPLLTGSAAAECHNQEQSSTPGFCFLSDDGGAPVGDPELLDSCASPRQMLKLSGDAVAAGSSIFWFCNVDPACG